MHRLLWNQAEKLTAVIAAWAIVLAPLTAVANCCCVAHTTLAQAADPAQSAVDRLEPISCCATPPTDDCASVPAPACCTPMAADNSPAVVTAQSCSCQTSCCDSNISQAAAIVNPPSQQVIPLDWDALFVTVLAPLPWETRSTWSEDSGEPVFLSAHARCARLCRWLN